MRTFETPDPISVTVELGVGNIHIEASDRIDTTVEVRPSDPAKKGDVTAADQMRVVFANGHLQVSGPSAWRQWLPGRGHESVDVEIALPTGSSVRAQAGVAGLHASGRIGEFHGKIGVGDVRLDGTGPLVLKTGAGDVTVDRIHGRAVVATGSGAVRIGDIDGPAVVKDANGDTWIGEVAGETRVSLANGSISIDRARDGVAAKTANGAVRIGEVERGAVVAQTAFGEIEVGIRDGIAAWLDLDTKFGQVHNDLDTSEGPAAGGGTVEVRATTAMGDITIRRSLGGAAERDAS